MRGFASSAPETNQRDQRFDGGLTAAVFVFVLTCVLRATSKNPRTHFQRRETDHTRNDALVMRSRFTKKMKKLQNLAS
jgi:hypothetical protein